MAEKWYPGKFIEKITKEKGVLKGLASPEEPTTKAYWASLIRDEEKADVEYRRLSDMMAPGGPLEAATWVREIIWGMAEDEKRHARQLQDILKLLERDGKIV